MAAKSVLSLGANVDREILTRLGRSIITDWEKELDAIDINNVVSRKPTLLTSPGEIRLIMSPSMPKDAFALVDQSRLAEFTLFEPKPFEETLHNMNADAYEVRIGAYASFEMRPSAFCAPFDMRNVQSFVLGMLELALRFGIETDIGDMGANFEFEREGHRVSLQVQFAGETNEKDPWGDPQPRLNPILPFPDEVELTIYDTMLKRPPQARIYRDVYKALFMMGGYWRWLRKRVRALQQLTEEP